MKVMRFVTVAIIVSLISGVPFGIMSVFASGENDRPSSTTVTARATEDVAQDAISAVPIYRPRYFNERRGVANWLKKWDTPPEATEAYIYLISQTGTVIGYYVTNGKPFSTESYLIPEEKYYANGATLQTQDLDGTYGSNQKGIRFFTPSGIAVEWSGLYIFTSEPLDLNVKLLGK